MKQQKGVKTSVSPENSDNIGNVWGIGLDLYLDAQLRKTLVIWVALVLPKNNSGVLIGCGLNVNDVIGGDGSFSDGQG